MTIKELYSQKYPKIQQKVISHLDTMTGKRESSIAQGIPTEEHFESKKELLIPLFVSSELNKTELKTFYLTRAQIFLIDVLAAKEFKGQSEYLRSILTSGLMDAILSNQFTASEMEEYSLFLDNAVENDLTAKEELFQNRRGRTNGKSRNIRKAKPYM